MALWNAKLTDIVLTADDPAAAVDYWAALLGGSGSGDAVLLGDGSRIVVRKGPTEALWEIGFAAGPELTEAAIALGGAPASDGAVVLYDPDGWRLRLDPVKEVAPTELLDATLSHCTLSSPSPRGQRAYYERLGFELSDELGEIFCWLRPNPIHHAMAFSRNAQTAIHHLAVVLPGKAAFIEAIDRVVTEGGRLEFGPGRHMVGGNLFAYLVDRFGLRWELCAELQQREPGQAPGLHTAQDRGRSVNTFGPPPPPSFIGEAGGPPPPRPD